MSKVKTPSNPGSGIPFLYSVVIIISVALAMIAAGGSRAAFGVFFKPMANDLGWSSTALSGTFTLSMIIEGIMGAISGWLSDKFGARIVLTISGIIAASGFFLIFYVNSIWQMYLVYGLAMGIGLGGIVIPVLSLLARIFTTSRTLMSGVALAANGLGQLISPLIANHLITAYNWRTSYIILSVAILILISIPAQFLPRRQSKVENNSAPNSDSMSPARHNYSLKEAMRTRFFWMMIAMLSCYSYCFIVIIVHAAPYAIEVGLSPSSAAGILACFGGTTVVGRLALGAVADRIGNKKMILIGLITLLVSLLWFQQAVEAWSLYLFAALAGLGVGGISSSQSPLSAEYFGLKSHGLIFGAVGGSTLIFGSVGSILTGYIFDITGQYRPAILLCAALVLVAIIINLRLKTHSEESKSSI